MDGFTVTITGEKMGLLNAVETYCTGIRSREAGRFSRGPGSRPPVALSALSFLSEVHRGARELHAELTQQVLGTARRGPAYSCLSRLPLLVSSERAWPESVEDAEHMAVRWVRRARLLLAEDRPPASVRALQCPHCATPSTLRLAASDGMSVGILYCASQNCSDPQGERYEWNASALSEFMGVVFESNVA